MTIVPPSDPDASSVTGPHPNALPAVPGEGTRRFTARVADYVAGRPTYPVGVIDLLRERVGFDTSRAVIDVGAGTGISSALFLAHGNRVTAAEPNDAMRAAADTQFADHPNFKSVAAPAEATTLSDHSADLIVAAQAFHWFDQVAFARECRRLLTPRGRVLLMWNGYQPHATPAAAAYNAVIRRHAIDLGRVESKWRDSQAVARDWFTPATFFSADLPNPQAFDAERLFMRMASSSYLPQRGQAGFDAMRRDCDAAFAEHAEAGCYALPYVCELFVGVPRGD